MAIVVVGGASKNVGKTGLVRLILSAFPDLHWTAVKLTQHPHGLEEGQPWALVEEQDQESAADTAAFLRAGASRALFLRTRPEKLADAFPFLHREWGDAPNVILESNSVLEFLRPDLYLAVLDPVRLDLKASAERFFPQADALVCWPLKPQFELPESISRKPLFVLSSAAASREEFLSFVKSRLRTG